MADVIRVLLVDDDPLVRVGLSMVLGAAHDIAVVGEAADGGAGIVASNRLSPDVVLMDIRMHGVDGLTATAELRASGGGPAVIVLTTFDSDEHILRALRAGANGFLLKDTPPQRILDAVRRVAAGESMLSPSVLTRLIERVAHSDGGEAIAARNRLALLAPREREVADAIGAGRSNMEIGAELFMSTATVKAYVSRIFAKLGCTNRVQVALVVSQAGQTS